MRSGREHTQYKEVQFIAKQTMDFIRKAISPGMKLAQVRKLCEDKMLELGADSFWYWNIGAFILREEAKTAYIKTGFCIRV